MPLCTFGSGNQRRRRAAREAVTAAASETGIPLGQWVEQAFSKALAEGLEAGVSIEELEARLRQVVAEALQPVQQALTRLETMPTDPSAPLDNSSSIRLPTNTW